MKIMKKYSKYIIDAFVMSIVTTTSCKKEFFNRPPEDAITIDNFYQTNDQVVASTNALYNSPWFGWVAKSGWAITELTSGNGRTYSDDVISLFNVFVNQYQPAYCRCLELPVHGSCAIERLDQQPAKKGVPIGRQGIVNNALGEAHLMRALAYFHIVRIWGNVPIIENSEDLCNQLPDQYQPGSRCVQIYHKRSEICGSQPYG
jgi:hypothetical protein